MEALRSFIEDAPIGAAMFDRDMRYLAYSPRWLQDHGVDRIALGSSHYEIFPALPQHWKDVHRRALAGETLRQPEERFERMDGSAIWLRWEARPWRTAEGKISGITIFTENITAQKQAEESLQEALARQRVAQAAGRIGIWDWGVSTNQAFNSDQWCVIFGLPPGCQSSYDRFLDRVHPDDRLAVDMKTRAALRGEGEIDLDFRIVRANDGAVRWVSSKGEIFFDSAGVATRAIGAIYDITERKEMERELREVSQRKSEFLATLAHELRNPLTPVRNAIGTLERLPDGDPKLKEKKTAILKMAARQVNYLVHLLNDLLDIERISHGKVKLERKEIDLSEPLACATELCETEIKAKGQALTVEPPAEPLVVLGDTVRLTQVFANLLDNASKYTDSGGRIEASARREGNEAVVRVRDNGLGLPQEMLATVFEMFAQQSSGGVTPGGLGIGLAFARSLVEAHGGEIRAESRGPGEGSEFVVRLPLARPG